MEWHKYIQAVIIADCRCIGKQWSVPRNHYLSICKEVGSRSKEGFMKKNSQKSKIDFRKEECGYTVSKAKLCCDCVFA